MPTGLWSRAPETPRARSQRTRLERSMAKEVLPAEPHKAAEFRQSHLNRLPRVKPRHLEVTLYIVASRGGGVFSGAFLDGMLSWGRIVSPNVISKALVPRVMMLGRGLCLLTVVAGRVLLEWGRCGVGLVVSQGMILRTRCRLDGPRPYSGPGSQKAKIQTPVQPKSYTPTAYTGQPADLSLRTCP